MASPSPLLYNTYYHIYNRGVNGEDIFIQERNYELFLRLFEKHLSPVVDLFAYCLLKNHFHISGRVKSEDEILASRKTLRVSFASGILATQGNSARHQNNHHQPGKPLGSHYVSDQFSNFFYPTWLPFYRPWQRQEVVLRYLAKYCTSLFQTVRQQLS